MFENFEELTCTKVTFPLFVDFFHFNILIRVTIYISSISNQKYVEYVNFLLKAVSAFLKKYTQKSNVTCSFL